MSGSADVPDGLLRVESGAGRLRASSGIRELTADGRQMYCSIAMDGIRARAGDGVVDDAIGIAKFRRKGIGDVLHRVHIALGDGEETQSILVGLGVAHAVELVVDVIGHAVGVDVIGDTQLLIDNAADAGLEEDEVVGIAGGKRDAFRLPRLNRGADIECRGVDDRGVGGDFNLGGHRARLQRLVDHRAGAGLDDNAGVVHGRKPGGLHVYGVGAQGKIRSHVESARIGLHLPGNSRCHCWSR